MSSACSARACWAAIEACRKYFPTGLPRLGELLGLPQGGQPPPDQQLVPPRAVLRLQQDRLAVLVEPGADPGTLDLQQRLQSEHLGLVGSERGQHAREPHRLARQVGAHPVLPRGGRVALVEDQVDDGHDVVESPGPLGPRGQLELGVSRGQCLLGSRDALAHGGFGGQEPTGDLGRGESSDQSQRQCGPGLGSQGGMAGQEDEPQDVVLDVVDLAVEVGHLVLLSPSDVFELRDLAAQVVRAPEVVDGAPLRDGHQPRDRVLRDAGRGPLLQRGHECVLGQVLGQVDVPGHPGESADEAGRFGPPRGEDGLGRVICSGLCRHRASVVSPGQSPGASGPVEIWRRVEITVTSGQYFACSSANSR